MFTLTQVGDLPRLEITQNQTDAALQLRRPTRSRHRPWAQREGFLVFGALAHRSRQVDRLEARLAFSPARTPQPAAPRLSGYYCPERGADNADSGTDHAVKGTDNADRGTVSPTDTADKGTESADTPACRAATRDSSRPQPMQGVLATGSRRAYGKRYAPQEHGPYNTRRAIVLHERCAQRKRRQLSAPSARRRDAPTAALPRPYLPSARWRIARRTPQDGSALTHDGPFLRRR